jgi:uncharacterized membrane protein YfcA
MPNDQPPIQSTQRFRVPVITTKNLSVVITGLVAIVALLKAKKGDIPKIAEMFFGSHVFASLGWALAFMILLGSVVFVKLLIRFYDNEVRRLSKERDDLQTKLLKR